jgi:hypothetical protein
MIDAIVLIDNAAQLPASLTDENAAPALIDPQATNATGARLHYVRMTAAQLNEWRPHVTVLAEAPYTGTGTADRVYQQIQDDAEKLAMYESVYDTAPREVDDGEGGTMTITPPFKFGILAESPLPVPDSVTSRQGMQQLIIAGLDEQVETAIASIVDVTERKLTQAWFQRATEWERDNPQFIGLMKELGLTDQEADDHMRAAALL